MKRSGERVGLEIDADAIELDRDPRLVRGGQDLGDAASLTWSERSGAHP